VRRVSFRGVQQLGRVVLVAHRHLRGDLGTHRRQRPGLSVLGVRANGEQAGGDLSAIIESTSASVGRSSVPTA
jgi:hypothetical protein